jgi:hypothetical protein
VTLIREEEANDNFEHACSEIDQVYKPSAKTDMRNAQDCNDDITEEVDLTLLQLDQQFLTDATQIDSFNVLVRSEISSLH